MKGKTIRVAPWSIGLLAILLVVGIAFASMGRSPQAKAAAVGNNSSPAIHSQAAIPQATPGQDFQDLVPSNTFYSYLHNLKQAGVVGGYNCVSGGDEDPCVPPDNLPYYHPGDAVTRLQMTKFIDLARRKIADATGNSLYISTTAGIAVDAETRSGGEAVYAECLQSGNNCYALEGYAPTGDYAAYVYGGKGTYTESDDGSYAAVNAHSYGTLAPGGEFGSNSYRAVQIDAPPSTVPYVQLEVNGQGNALYAQRIDNGALYVQGNLTVGGSKSGYVVDVMQNASTDTLEPGDIVTIVGNSAPVLGQIPVVTVRKAASTYDTGVAGVVDQVMYVPDATTKAAYEREQAAMRAAMQQRDQAMAAAKGKGNKPDLSSITVPQASITDEQGTLHADAAATQVQPNGYANVVTLGSYKAVKVDASFGPIHAGDLLVASSHAGYAMKGADRSLTSGATIGKALGNLETGTGLIPVMVTLK